MADGCSLLSVVVYYTPSIVEATTDEASEVSVIPLIDRGILDCECEEFASLECEVYDVSELTCTSLIDKANVRVEFVCDLGKPYLFIEPTTLWILPELYTDNDVISNTNWFVD